MSQGYLALVLHSHLPFVRHPEHEFFLEEEWLYEAITETYIPLINVLENLVKDKVPFRLTLCMSPTLIFMLKDSLLKQRYERHLAQLEKLVEKESQRTKTDNQLSRIIEHYKTRLSQVRKTWDRLCGEIVDAFVRFLDLGYLDILTCAATHGYLPLLQVQPQAVWAQIKVAVDYHYKVFGREPTGIWLPECGYYPGIDEFLAKAGLRYFVADTHGVLFSQPRPRFGSFAPIYIPGSGVAVFPRDVETSVQVWSREHGYPKDPCYREFYRDIGFDLDMETIGPFLRPRGIRKNTGIKYHRITGNTDQKELYDPVCAHEKAAEHASDFMINRVKQIKHAHSIIERPALVVAPYDTELFGHWWYEGPAWLDFTLRKCAYEQKTFELTNLAEYLETYTEHQVAEPEQSSWGYDGFHQVWVDDKNVWIYPLIHKAAEQMIQMATRWRKTSELKRRALNQAARELLLSQASDWAFMINAETTVAYAEQRTRTHVDRFDKLRKQIYSNVIDEKWLSDIESKDNIFPDIDYRVYR